MSLKLAIAGGGAMGGALANGLIRSKTLAPSAIVVIEPLAARRDELKRQFGVKVTDDPAGAKDAEVLLLAVKPQSLPEAGPAYGRVMGKRTVVSILAGATVGTLKGYFQGGIARVMPNTPALVGEGASAVYFSADVAAAERKRIREWLSSVGRVMECGKESDLDAVTGLSGSGPAYVFEMIEALSDGGVLMGLGREVATQLAAQTVLGAAKMVLESGKHPAQLKDQVTSPGGTTIAGLEQLELRGMRAAFIEAVRAATERSRQLGAAPGTATLAKGKKGR